MSIHTKPPQPDLPPWLVMGQKFSAILQVVELALNEQQDQIACLCREIDALKAAIPSPPLWPITKTPGYVRPPRRKDQP
ncbi:hypothetical protein [Phyllobacterium sp. P5_D12]